MILWLAYIEAVFGASGNLRFRDRGAQARLLMQICCNVVVVRSPDKLTSYVLELLAPLGPVSARRMFGGVGLFHGGMMFGLIAREELFFKVGDANRPTYEAAGEAPFSYDTNHGTNTIGSYWRCPPELLDDAETFQAWAREAIEAAVVAARGKPKAGRKRRAAG